MSIYPPGTKSSSLTYKWEIAALDLPIPDDLGADDRQDVQEWYNYLNCLSPAQQLRKLAQALDQFHNLIVRTADPLTLPEEQQVVLFSKWLAASGAAGSLAQRFDFMTEETYKDNGTLFHSDIDLTLFRLIDFLKSVQSPEVKIWEERRAEHNRINDAVFAPFLSKRYSLLGSLTAKPPGGGLTP